MCIPLKLMYMVSIPRAKLERPWVSSAASMWILQQDVFRFNSTACSYLDTYNIPFL